MLQIFFSKFSNEMYNKTCKTYLLLKWGNNHIFYPNYSTVSLDTESAFSIYVKYMNVLTFLVFLLVCSQQQDTLEALYCHNFTNTRFSIEKFHVNFYFFKYFEDMFSNIRF